MNKKLLLALAVVGMTSCNSIYGPNEALPKVMLEIEFQNYAFGKQYFGYFVNGLGDVYNYNRNGVPWEFQDSTSWTRETLDQKFVPIKNMLHTRPNSEVTNIQAKIDALVPGQLSQRKHECADAGELTYYAYRYDVEGGRYTERILLRQEGDFAQQNTSPAAQDLIAYIRSLNLVQEMLGCDP